VLGQGAARSWSLLAACAVLLVACASRAGTIGAILTREQSGRTFVRDVPPHLAAYQAGVRRGDEVLFVEGRQVGSLSDAELHSLLSGPVDQEVHLTLARDKTTILRLSVSRSPAEPYRPAP